MKTCFVVQGFGEKTDLTTGRVLNLDASYDVIKEAVEAADFRCVRADEIAHSGTIDQPMYEWLYRADLVIADLSTYNVNAALELGIRYGLRPQSTIIVAESNFKNPFDLTHIVIRRYEHLGKDIGRREAQRFKKDLSDAIRLIVTNGEVDSPVYTFLPLRPPTEKPRVQTEGIARELPAIADPPAAGAAESAKDVLEHARAAMSSGDFMAARGLFEKIRVMRPRDEYVVQQLALAIYRSQHPDPMTALKDAETLLMELRPGTTHDPETLGLWGAVHTRFWDLTTDPMHLDSAIAGYERGYILTQDFAPGIALAFLLDVRASYWMKQREKLEGIADAVRARRVRRDVAAACERALAKPASNEVRYSIIAALWEANAGLGDREAAAKWKAEVESSGVPGFMVEATSARVERLVSLLETSPLAS